MEKQIDLASKVIYATYDYELFFKRSGSVYNSLIAPTNQILQKLKSNNQSATFFVDATYLLKLKELQFDKAQKDYMLIVTQLHEIVTLGNRIELHLHPHWVDAIYLPQTNTWDFSNMTHYRMETLDDDMLVNLFGQGKSLLEDIAREVIPDYKIVAFRAGGWCIQPFSKMKNAFISNNILFDSSVSPGIKLNSMTHSVDFTSLDVGISAYKFTNDVTSPEESGLFNEIPITSYVTNPFHFILHRLFLRILSTKRKSIYGDGIGTTTNIKQTWFNKLYLIFRKRQVEMLTLDGYLINSFLIHEINKSPVRNIVIISHPKLFNPNSLCFFDLAKKNKWNFATINEFDYRR